MADENSIWKRTKIGEQLVASLGVAGAQPPLETTGHPKDELEDLEEE